MLKKLIFLMLLVPNFAWSAPSITSTSGTFTHGSSFTIPGSGFQTKSTPTPLFYDNFDSNDTGRQNRNTIHTKNASHYGVWANITGAEVPTYSNANQRGVSTLSSYVHFWAEKYHNSGFIQANFSENHVPTLMFSYWIRVSYANATGDGNVKVTKLLDNSGQYSDDHDNLQDAFQFARAPKEAYMNVWAGSDGQPSVWPDNNGSSQLGYTVPFDNWYQVTWFRKAGTNGNSDGKEWVIVNGTTLKNTSFAHNWNIGKKWCWLVLGNYIANYTTLDVYFQFDDVYIDNTWQSVWTGNASTWSSCTHREIQIPTAWSDTSITITGNQGSFATGSTVYLYVVDDNGNVNSQGYPVIIEKAVSPPSPPQGLRITN